MRRIALCLSGISRDIDLFFPVTKSGLLDVLNPDIFLACWENDYTTCWTSDHQKAIELYKPVLYHTEYQNLVGDPPRTELTEKFMNVYPRKDRWANFAKGYPYEKQFKTSWGRQNMLNLFYMIWRCNELKREYQRRNNFTYDIVIRARVDRGWEVKHELYQEKGKIFLHNIKSEEELSDWFAYGASLDMDKYSNIYPNIVHLCLQMENWDIDETHQQAWYKWLDPHRTLKLHLENEGLRWHILERPELRGHGKSFDRPLP